MLHASTSVVSSVFEQRGQKEKNKIRAFDSKPTDGKTRDRNK